MPAGRERDKRPHKPKGFEDILGNGVVLLNRGEYAEAVKAFHQAAEIHPRNEHVQYCLAAANARVGDLPAAREGSALGDPREPGEPDAGPDGSRTSRRFGGGGLRGAARPRADRVTEPVLRPAAGCGPFRDRTC